MPRPTAAQLAYGTATVVCSTLVMLLLSGTTAGPGIAVIGLAALGLGLLVALTVPANSRTSAARTAPAPRPATPPATSAQLPGPRAEARIGQPSLRR
ncbi:hypothetical protein OIE62_16340 [Streptomyces scopuliridis]|uniref:Uncharacterized protein n=2 Tax=Streptomyces scopuliridis TaxID=452529 RepID=A0A2T7TF86_9ACTN|nr:hypothetical protein [Streptomyces scopuliridis]PVE13792.1 hypothetical protein Y717_08590 [Streptomyces scopuliridis RB72]WSB35653.1 hypothetical protein OG949_24275 [Streptomyces scopuliridis]WSB99865.1 hypothetical protein OG835_24615 [Streptomyces scopuliridis]WSC06436.1 hypothetical protein OIE62_16340 [Streptomyces scopuliridis]